MFIRDSYLTGYPVFLFVKSAIPNWRWSLESPLELQNADAWAPFRLTSTKSEFLRAVLSHTPDEELRSEVVLTWALFVAYLLCARHCTGCWGYDSEQTPWLPFALMMLSVWGQGEWGRVKRQMLMKSSHTHTEPPRGTRLCRMSGHHSVSWMIQHQAGLHTRQATLQGRLWSS